jgi:hypothetical protein
LYDLIECLIPYLILLLYQQQVQNKYFLLDSVSQHRFQIHKLLKSDARDPASQTFSKNKRAGKNILRFLHTFLP